MKTILNILLFILVFSLQALQIAKAEVLDCTGKDDKGAALTVEFDSSANPQTLKVNGVIHKIQAPTQDASGVATENYETDKLVYDSFIKDSNTKFTLHRFDAMTDETVFKVDINCNVVTTKH